MGPSEFYQLRALLLAYGNLFSTEDSRHRNVLELIKKISALFSTQTKLSVSDEEFKVRCILILTDIKRFLALLPPKLEENFTPKDRNDIHPRIKISQYINRLKTKIESFQGKPLYKTALENANHLAFIEDPRNLFHFVSLSLPLNFTKDQFASFYSDYRLAIAELFKNVNSYTIEFKNGRALFFKELEKRIEFYLSKKNLSQETIISLLLLYGDSYTLAKGTRVIEESSSPVINETVDEKTILVIPPKEKLHLSDNVLKISHALLSTIQLENLGIIDERHLNFLRAIKESSANGSNNNNTKDSFFEILAWTREVEQKPSLSQPQENVWQNSDSWLLKFLRNDITRVPGLHRFANNKAKPETCEAVLKILENKEIDPSKKVSLIEEKFTRSADKLKLTRNESSELFFNENSNLGRASYHVVLLESFLRKISTLSFQVSWLFSSRVKYKAHEGDNYITHASRLPKDFIRWVNLCKDALLYRNGQTPYRASLKLQKELLYYCAVNKPEKNKHLKNAQLLLKSIGEVKSQPLAHRDAGQLCELLDVSKMKLPLPESDAEKTALGKFNEGVGFCLSKISNFLKNADTQEYSNILDYTVYQYFVLAQSCFPSEFKTIDNAVYQAIMRKIAELFSYNKVRHSFLEGDMNPSFYLSQEFNTHRKYYDNLVDYMEVNSLESSHIHNIANNLLPAMNFD
jgi:hypothetical protein